MSALTTKSTRWWWIRHAPVPQLADRIYGNTDPDCDVSDQQAFSALAQRLPSDAVWIVSHLRRTRQTADAIHGAGYPLPELIVEPDFGEQNFGDLHGVLHTEHNQSRTDPFKGFWANPPKQTPPGGESFVDVVNRVREAVEQHSTTHRGRDIVCVAHGGPIIAATSIALTLDVDTAVAINIPNLSLTRLYKLHDSHPDAPAWQVHSVAERPSV